MRGRNERQDSISSALKISLISVSAVLYAAGIAVTSPISTPWGVGHFRPGVVIPAFFAVTCGPLIGGAGAGLGCWLGDLALSFWGLTDPILSLIAGVPGNFVGFYLLGWLTSRFRSWGSFILGSLVSFTIGNFICAFGVVGYFSTVVPVWAPWPIEVKLATIVGFTLFWVATMIPFVIPLVPIIMKGAEPVLNKTGSIIKNPRLSWGKPSSLAVSWIFVAMILTVMYLVSIFTPVGDVLFSKVTEPQLVPWVKALLLIAAGVVTFFGVSATIVATRVFRKPE